MWKTRYVLSLRDSVKITSVYGKKPSSCFVLSLSWKSARRSREMADSGDGRWRGECEGAAVATPWATPASGQPWGYGPAQRAESASPPRWRGLLLVLVDAGDCGTLVEPPPLPSPGAQRPNAFVSPALAQPGLARPSASACGSQPSPSARQSEFGPGRAVLRGAALVWAWYRQSRCSQWSARTAAAAWR